MAQIDDEFWFVAPEVIAEHGDSPIFLRFATFDDAAEVVVDMPAIEAFIPVSLTIPANSADSLNLSDSLVWMVENKPFDEVLDKGIHIVSSADISVYYEVNHPSNADIFALKGKNALGLSFHLPFQDFTTNNFGVPIWFDVVATEAYPHHHHPNTEPHRTSCRNAISVTLPFAGMTYSGRASSSGAQGHPVGTMVVSDKPVAVTIR